MRVCNGIQAWSPAWWLGFALVLLSVAVGAAPRAAWADTDKRVALVIGNGDYKAAPRLDNPASDARAVAASLRRLGFQVVDGYDLTAAQMRTALADFSSSLPDAKAALVFYAGHGVSVDEENYMLPTDIVLRSPTDLDINAISISVVLKQMKRDDHVNVVILDACRDNPFAAELARKKTRAVIGERGLSAIDGELARGTLIAFASDPKSTALDGKPGENSPFTKALLNHLEDAGVPIDTVMNRVRTEVWSATQNKQLPWVNTSIIGEFSLNPKAAPAADTVGAPLLASVQPDRTASETRGAQENMLWESAQRSNLPSDYEAYLEAFPSGIFAHMARNRIAAASQPATAPQPSRSDAPAPPAVSPAALKAEIGTLATETALALSVEQRRQLQQRLVVMEFDAGPINGEFGPKMRAALADWQTRHQVTPTSWLGPLQYAALMAESESQYQRMVVAQAMSPAVTRAIQPVHKLPVRKVVVARRAHASGAHAAAPDGGSAALGSFFGGVASGLISHMINH